MTVFQQHVGWEDAAGQQNQPTREGSQAHTNKLLSLGLRMGCSHHQKLFLPVPFT